VESVDVDEIEELVDLSSSSDEISNNGGEEQNDGGMPGGQTNMRLVPLGGFDILQPLKVLAVDPF